MARARETVLHREKERRLESPSFSAAAKCQFETAPATLPPSHREESVRTKKFRGGKEGAFAFTRREITFPRLNCQQTIVVEAECAAGFLGYFIVRRRRQRRRRSILSISATQSNFAQVSTSLSHNSRARHFHARLSHRQRLAMVGAMTSRSARENQSRARAIQAPERNGKK